MADRISAAAPYGSLLKTSIPARKPREKREHSSSHLALIRRLPCLSCDTDPTGEAAHLRSSGLGKSITGVGIKPDDKWTLPLCHTCHMRQHEIGETEFWAELGINPFLIAAKLATLQSVEAMRQEIFRVRENRK